MTGACQEFLHAHLGSTTLKFTIVTIYTEVSAAASRLTVNMYRETKTEALRMRVQENKGVPDKPPYQARASLDATGPGVSRSRLVEAPLTLNAWNSDFEVSGTTNGSTGHSRLWFGKKHLAPAVTKKGEGGEGGETILRGLCGENETFMTSPLGRTRRGSGRLMCDRESCQGTEGDPAERPGEHRLPSRLQPPSCRHVTMVKTPTGWVTYGEVLSRIGRDDISSGEMPSTLTAH